jgi:hypothetical protein
MTAFRPSEAERSEVRAAARQAAGVPLAGLTPESFPLPTAGVVLRRLAREVTGGAGFAPLRGVPVDGDPDLVCAGVGSHAGTIVPQGAQRAPVQHITDQGADPRAPTTLSYQHSGALGYHADPRPGDMQFLNNHIVLHRRTAYEDHPEPESRRDLIRLWLDARTSECVD